MMSDKSKSRWDELNRQKDTLLQRISNGKATPTDLAQLEQILSKSSDVATSLFKEGVKVIEEAAKQRVDAVQEKRRNKGKTPLSPEAIERLLDQALTRSWLEYGPMLADDIRDGLELVTDTIEQKIDEQTYTLMEYGEDNAKSVNEIRDIAYEIWDQLDRNADPATPSISVAAPDLTIILDRIQLLFGSVRHSSELVRDMSARFGGLQSKLDELLTVNKDIQDFIDSERQNLAEDYLQDSPDIPRDRQHIEDPEVDDPVEEERERRRDWLNGFWRRFSNFSPRFGSHANSGLLKELLQIGGLLMLTNDELRSWVGDRIKDMQEFYSELSLKSVMDDIWASMNTQARTLLDWIRIKLGIDDETVQQRRIEDIDKDIDEYTNALTEQQSILSDPKSMDIEKWWAKRNIDKMSQWIEQRLDEREEAVNRLSEIRSSQASTPPTPSGGLSQSSVPANELNQTSVSNNINGGNLVSTTNYVTPDIKEGDQIVEDPNRHVLTTTNNKSNPSPTSGTPPINIADISFEPAINDQLRLANMLALS